MCTILKRDGREVPFDSNKISMAICAAYKNTSTNNLTINEYKPIADRIALKIADIASSKNKLTVENIQNIVEEELMDENKAVAKQYIIYRNDRSRVRETTSPLMQTINEKLQATNVQNQNANIDEHSFGGRLGEARNELVKSIALNNYVSEMSRNNHLNNMIYIHDLDSYAIGMHNCLSIPFDDLLAKGFNTRQTDVRPAGSVNTAFQLIAVLFQLQSLQEFGGVSATHLDWTMVPYVRKSFFKHYITSAIKDSDEFLDLDLMDILFDTYEDEVGVIRDKFDDWLEENKDDILDKLNLKKEDIVIDNKENLNSKYYQGALFDTIVETRQAVEGMYHNLNTLQSRSGNQLPFTSINYGTCTSSEGRLVIKALLDGCIKGVGAIHKTAVFPCGIFQLGKGINREPGDPNYDMYQLAIKSTVRRLYPNYANIDWSGNEGYDKNDPCTYFSTIDKLVA